MKDERAVEGRHFILHPSVEQFEAAGLRAREEGEEVFAGHFARAEGFHVRGEHLYVEPAEAARAEVFDEVEQRELRGVGPQVEHALAGEGPARVHAVDAADQLLALPRLDAVRAPAPVKLAVAPDHPRRDPSPLLAGALDPGAGADDALEGAVDRERQARAAPLAREAAR